MIARKSVVTILLLVAVMAGLALPAAADFKAGLAAYKKGDYAAALKQWRPLAEQGDRQAQFALGTIYHNGKGVAKDVKESTKWYMKAANQGDPRAMAIVGLKYVLGSGVKKNKAEAYKWLNLAFMYGKKTIKPQLLSLEKSEPASVIQAGRARGARMARARADTGDPLATAVVGVIYTLGRGVPKDLVKGYAWMDLAFARGFKGGDGLRDQVAAKMSEEQVAEAKKLAAQLKAEMKKK